MIRYFRDRQMSIKFDQIISLSFNQVLSYKITMRHRGKDSRERHQGRSSEREPRSRDHKPYREREREPIENPDWRRDNQRGQYPQGKVQDRERHITETVVRVNRKQTCPFLVKVFYSINKQNVFESNGSVPEPCLFMHLWMDCTLRELGELLRAHIPAIRTKQRFQFWRIYSEQDKPAFCKQEMGTVMMLRRGEHGQDRLLSACKFRVGDSIDVSIYYK